MKEAISIFDYIDDNFHTVFSICLGNYIVDNVIYKEENGNKILRDVEEINSLNRENIARDFLINEWFCLTIDNGKKVYKRSNNIFKNFEIERDINDLVKILAYDIDYAIPFAYAKCYLNIKDRRISQITEEELKQHNYFGLKYFYDHNIKECNSNE